VLDFLVKLRNALVLFIYKVKLAGKSQKLHFVF